MQAQPETSPARGRPRGVDPTQALDAAVRVFWTQGYDGASVDRLCRATGMTRSSLYQDYGGKEGLFLAAIARYVETRLSPLSDALEPRGTLQADLESFFAQVVRLGTGDRQTPGCLISCVLADVAGANETFRLELERRCEALEGRIAQRLARQMHPQDPRPLAGMLAAVARGMMLRARSGAQAPVLEAIARVAVQSVLGSFSLHAPPRPQ